MVGSLKVGVTLQGLFLLFLFSCMEVGFPCLDKMPTGGGNEPGAIDEVVSPPAVGREGDFEKKAVNFCYSLRSCQDRLELLAGFLEANALDLKEVAMSRNFIEIVTSHEGQTSSGLLFEGKFFHFVHERKMGYLAKALLSGVLSHPLLRTAESSVAVKPKECFDAFFLGKNANRESVLCLCLKVGLFSNETDSGIVSLLAKYPDGLLKSLDSEGNRFLPLLLKQGLASLFNKVLNNEALHKYIRQKRIFLNELAGTQRSLLFEAAILEESSFLRGLVEMGAVPSFEEDKLAEHPVFVAALNHRIANVEMLIASDTSVLALCEKAAPRKLIKEVGIIFVKVCLKACGFTTDNFVASMTLGVVKPGFFYLAEEVAKEIDKAKGAEEKSAKALKRLIEMIRIKGDWIRGLNFGKLCERDRERVKKCFSDKKDLICKQLCRLKEKVNKADDKMKEWQFISEQHREEFSNAQNRIAGLEESYKELRTAVMIATSLLSSSNALYLLDKMRSFDEVLSDVDASLNTIGSSLGSGKEQGDSYA